MGKITKAPEFAVGDYVFAKVKGYPHWPAEVKQVLNANWYMVTFFGTKDSGRVCGSSICLYNDENCVKIQTEREMSKPAYRDAVDALEANRRFNEQLMRQFAEGNVAEEEEETNEENIPPPAIIHAPMLFTSRRIKKEPKKASSIVINPSMLPVSTSIINPAKVNLLRIQFLIIDYDFVIRTSLGYNKARVDLDKGLKKMQAMSIVLKQATQYMLLKYPQIVETQRNLRYYTGNVGAWKMSKRENETFSKKAELIKMLAQENYNQIEDLFDIPHDSTFEMTFTAQVAEVKQKRESKQLNFDAMFETTSMTELDNLEEGALSTLVDPVFITP